MSSSIALRRSPKPGALTAVVFRMPRMLFTTSVASASPSTSSAMISSGLPALATCSSTGSRSRMLRDLLVVQEDVRVFQDGDLLVRVVDEVRRDVAAVELHAFDEVELVLEALAVFDGDHAFLADLVHRFGDRLADRLVGVGRDGADLRDFLAGRAGLADLLQLFDDGDDRLVDAALQVHRVHAGGDVLHAFGARSTARARSRWWCRHRRRRRSWTRLPSPSARPCSRTCPSARFPWRRTRRPW